MTESGTDAAVDALRDRYRGMLLGLALGDAVAAPAQHRRPGTFTRIGDLSGGGPFELPRGAWTDDAAVPLIIAESLVEADGLDRRDVDRRLGAWQPIRRRSSTRPASIANRCRARRSPRRSSWRIPNAPSRSRRISHA